jgi:8-oxo-dGTP diphosphatase
MGEVDFCFPNRPDWNQRVIFYRTFIWRGELIETDEMRPAFFRFDTIPYSEMWPGDDLWLPYLIRGEMFGGEIHFTGEGDGVEWSNIYLEK